MVRKSYTPEQILNKLREAEIHINQGTHPKIVQERLGHSSISITLDTYSHVAPGLQEAAAARFDEALTTKYNKRVIEAAGNRY